MTKIKITCNNCGYTNAYINREVPEDADCKHCGEALNIMVTDEITVNDGLSYSDLERGLKELAEGNDNPTPNYYNYMFRGIKIDPYRIMKIYNITHPAQQQALKKILRLGTHDKRELKEDIEGIISALQRWLEMIDEEERTKKAWKSLKE